MRTHTPATHNREVMQREAERRGVEIDWTADPDGVPEGLRHSAAFVVGRGWCVWASHAEDPVVLPSERDWYPLVLVGDRWESTGWSGIRVSV